MTPLWSWPCYIWVKVKVLTLHQASDATPVGRGRGIYFGQVGVEVQAPHTASTDTTGVGQFLSWPLGMNFLVPYLAFSATILVGVLRCLVTAL